MIVPMRHQHQINSPEFLQKLQAWAEALGFSRLSISSIQLEQAEQRLLDWLDKGYHGDMAYMQSHGVKRSRPADLLPGTRSVITVLMNYYPEADQETAKDLLNHDKLAYVSRYALGRDYHGIIRKSLQKLIDKIQSHVSADFQFRAFSDSAPVLEKPLAQQSGLGWMGKHTNIINRELGSWFFLGEIYTNLDLPAASPVSAHCGDCIKCIEVCPTQAIIEPYVLDARRCISYLTIEHHGSIPIELRPLMGNRIYGCDDCQLFCPWNRFAEPGNSEFNAKNNLHDSSLLHLFSWNEDQFLDNFRGSPIRRIGFARWQRNIAVALGNAQYDQAILHSLESHPGQGDMVDEHVQWAIQQQKKKLASL